MLGEMLKALKEIKHHFLGKRERKYRFFIFV